MVPPEGRRKRKPIRLVFLLSPLQKESLALPGVHPPTSWNDCQLGAEVGQSITQFTGGDHEFGVFPGT